MFVIPLIALANAEPGAAPQPQGQQPPPAQQPTPPPPPEQKPQPAPEPQQVQQQPAQQPQPQPQTGSANNNQPAAPAADNEMNACDPDVKEFCPKAKTEKKKVACLQENRSKVITACLKVVDNKLRIEKEEAEKRRNGGK